MRFGLVFMFDKLVAPFSCVLNALRRQCDLDPVCTIRGVMFSRCSTPYGDNAIWTQRRRRARAALLCAQRLTATMRFGRLDLGQLLLFHYVLNALRRQCDLDGAGHPGRLFVLRMCSTPYGDNAIWTISDNAVQLEVSASAQRLTATMRFGRDKFDRIQLSHLACSTPYGDNAIWT